MRYIMEIHIDEKAYTYHIDAKDEDQAYERLLLRLAPNKREFVKVDTIQIDPNSIMPQEPYGIFTGE